MVPAATTPGRVQAIEAEGARVEHVDGDYDAAVVRAASLADDRHLVIADTSWPGYEDVPRRVVEGYATIFAELDAQLDGPDGGPGRRAHRGGLAGRRGRPPLPRDARASARGSSGSSRSTPPARWPRRGPGSRSRSTTT